MSAEVRFALSTYLSSCSAVWGESKNLAGSVISPTISPLRMYLGVLDILAIGTKGLDDDYQGIGDSKKLVLGARKENLLDEPFMFVSEIAFHFDGFDGVNRDTSIVSGSNALCGCK